MQAVIGLEIHAQLSVRSKIFSPAPARYCADPNTQACEIDLGLPGVLPTLNRAAAAQAIRFGLAVGGEISEVCEFARKNYFYPDLPKGYQISQYEFPLVRGGAVEIETAQGERTIRLIRAHLEEDAGKLLHDDWDGMSAVDLNRAGTPLLEIVSAPDLRSPAAAAAYAKTLRALVRYLDICDGNMQEGSFRIDANVSVRQAEEDALGTRCEIKNLNSFRFLEQALGFEIERQRAVLAGGGAVAQETRLFDPRRGETRAMRGKEEARDYRYFPDPDLPPLTVAKEWIEEIRRDLPELPRARRARFVGGEYRLSPYDASLLCAERAAADYFEEVVAALRAAACAPPPHEAAKIAANWQNGEVANRLSRRGQTRCPFAPAALAALLARVLDGAISGSVAKQVLDEMWDGGKSADQVIAEKGLAQISDAAALEELAARIIAAHPAQAEQFHAGREKLLGFFVGLAMKESRGKADPRRLSDIVRRLLKA